MAVTEKQASIEAIQAEQAETEKKQSAFKDTLLSSLDLPEEKPAKSAADNEPVEEQAEGEEAHEEQAEGEQEEQEGEQADVEDEGDVVPRSKFDKAREHMQRRINDLQAQLKRQQAQETKSAAVADDDMVKLERMSEQELRELKRQVRVEQIKAKDNDAYLKRLVDLEEKIDDYRISGPQRFHERQVAQYQAKAEEIIAENPDLDLDTAAPAILKRATAIFVSDPDLRKLERGQAIALQLAFDQYKEVNKLTPAKSKETQLRQQVTNLKRKTSLDTSASRGAADVNLVNKLRAKAFRGGDQSDRMNLIKNDPAFGIETFLNDVPEEYKGRMT